MKWLYAGDSRIATVDVPTIGQVLDTALLANPTSKMLQEGKARLASHAEAVAQTSVQTTLLGHVVECRRCLESTGTEEGEDTRLVTIDIAGPLVVDLAREFTTQPSLQMSEVVYADKWGPQLQPLVSFALERADVDGKFLTDIS